MKEKDSWSFIRKEVLYSIVLLIVLIIYDLEIV